MVLRAVSRGRTLLDAINRGARCRRGVATSSTAPAGSKAFPTTIPGLLGDSPRRRKEGELIPVYVSAGMIALSVSLGLLAAQQQLRYSPNVYVSKKRREMFPEVYDPDWAAAEVDRFLSRSIFRRVAHAAHLRDFDRIRSELAGSAGAAAPLQRVGRVEDLRTVGVDPRPQ